MYVCLNQISVFQTLFYALDLMKMPEHWSTCHIQSNKYFCLANVKPLPQWRFTLPFLNLCTEPYAVSLTWNGHSDRLHTTQISTWAWFSKNILWLCTYKSIPRGSFYKTIPSWKPSGNALIKLFILWRNFYRIIPRGRFWKCILWWNI